MCHVVGRRLTGHELGSIAMPHVTPAEAGGEVTSVPFQAAVVVEGEIMDLFARGTSNVGMTREVLVEGTGTASHGTYDEVVGHNSEGARTLSPDVDLIPQKAPCAWGDESESLRVVASPARHNVRVAHTSAYRLGEIPLKFAA